MNKLGTMKKLNTVLVVSVLALFLLSFLSWRASISRTQRFERGQKFLPNLDPDAIAEIEIEKTGNKTHLRRGKDHFVVASAGGYPAKNEAVNRLVRDVLAIGLEKKVGSGEALEKELGLASGGAETIDVSFKDSSAQTMVRFRVGRTANSSYVRRVDRPDDPIYLTSSQVYLSADGEEFLQDEILDVKQDQIAVIRGSDFKLSEQNDDLGADASKLGQLRSLLSYLRFEKHHLANAPELQGLVFGDPIEVELKDRSGYQLRVAEQGGKHYLQIQGFMAVRQVAVGPDDSDEKNTANAELLKRADEIKAFNDLHGSWIYEVSDTVAEKVRMRRAELLGG